MRSIKTDPIISSLDLIDITTPSDTNFGVMPRPTRSTSQSAASTTPKKLDPPKSRKSSYNQKSKYFEHPDSEDSSVSEISSVPTSPKLSPTETDDDNDAPPRKKSKASAKKSTPRKVTPKKATPQKRPKQEDETDELWETFVPKEATPEAGDIPYKNETIHPNTLQFLKGRFLFNALY